MPIRLSGAHDLKLFEKYGLDTELVYVSGARPIQAMLGGSIDVSQVGGAATVSAAAQGADVVILGTIFSRLNFAVHASPQIKQISDLKGKTLVTGTVGGNTYFAALLFLSRFNWAPNRDVHLIGVGGSREVLGALTQGRFPAGVLTAPTTHLAARMGFRPGACLAVFEGDYATATLATRAGDPLNVCAEAFREHFVHDPWLVRRLPQLMRATGVQLQCVRSYGYVEASKPGFMLSSWVDLGADALAASGRIGADAAAALKAEARRRVRSGEYFGHIAYISLVARKRP
jgi:NMT1/THI5 like